MEMNNGKYNVTLKSMFRAFADDFFVSEFHRFVICARKLRILNGPAELYHKNKGPIHIPKSRNYATIKFPIQFLNSLAPSVLLAESSLMPKTLSWLVAQRTHVDRIPLIIYKKVHMYVHLVIINHTAVLLGL